METKVIFQDNDVQRIVFHFNKQHNIDQSIPPWIIKHKGQTYYVNHLDSNIGFSTKETLLNPTTKGSLMFRGKLTIIKQDEEMIAMIE